LVVPARHIEPYEGLLLAKCKVFLRWSAIMPNSRRPKGSGDCACVLGCGSALPLLARVLRLEYRSKLITDPDPRAL